MPEVIRISGVDVEPGRRKRVDIPAARLPTDTWLSLPIEVLNGIKPGPRLWLSAAVHGDELNGVEIIRELLEKLDPLTLRGSLIAAPIVNVHGFIQQSRYLPDRRDLNRSFPGSLQGSLAARLAHLFMHEVVMQCSHGIDLHTGSNYRTNLPQIRANLQDAETRRCAEAFGAPVMVHSQTRDGSLRQAATKRGIHVLVYEAGEPMRFDAESIRLGVRGVLRVMTALEMRTSKAKRKPPASVEVTESTWVRARRSGILRLQVELGQRVARRETLGVIADAFGENQSRVKAPADGLILGFTNNPLVNRGDGIFHVATGIQ